MCDIVRDTRFGYVMFGVMIEFLNRSESMATEQDAAIMRHVAQLIADDAGLGLALDVRGNEVMEDAANED